MVAEPCTVACRERNRIRDAGDGADENWLSSRAQRGSARATRATPDKLLRAPASRSLVAEPALSEGEGLLGMTIALCAPCPALSAFKQFQAFSNTELSALTAFSPGTTQLSASAPLRGW